MMNDHKIVNEMKEAIDDGAEEYGPFLVDYKIYVRLYEIAKASLRAPHVPHTATEPQGG